MQINTDELPLGQLTKQQVQKGLDILQVRLPTEYFLLVLNGLANTFLRY